jgi:hypothetical protein
MAYDPHYEGMMEGSMGRAFYLGLNKYLTELQLISSRAKMNFTTERVLSDMAWEFRLGLIEKSPILACEEETLP